MVGATATATEMQNNFGRYLNIVIGGEEVIITKNGKEVGRLVPKAKTASYLTDSLRGVLSASACAEDVREEDLRQKYEIVDRR